jgi:hypothetical protein
MLSGNRNDLAQFRKRISAIRLLKSTHEIRQRPSARR